MRASESSSMTRVPRFRPLGIVAGGGVVPGEQGHTMPGDWLRATVLEFAMVNEKLATM